ncbi:hypothetical protein CR513_32320, partial [Mucuna pruriens]
MFPNLRKSKLLPHGDGPFKIIKKINDNAYILEMSQTYEGSHTFNVHLTHLRANSFEEGEPDKDLGSPRGDSQEVEDSQAFKGPLTKGKAKESTKGKACGEYQTTLIFLTQERVVFII